MLALSEVYKIALEDAQKNYEGSELQDCTDIGDRFVFSISYENRSIKGASLITVDKNSGELGYLNLPNEENFELLRNGTEVDISDIKN